MRDNRYPHDPNSLSRMSRIPARFFKEALPRLVAIGWIDFEHHAAQIPQEGAGLLRDDRHLTAPIPHYHAPSRARAVREEGEVREGGEGTASKPHHPLPESGQENLTEPFEEFQRDFIGPIPDDAYQAFARAIKTDENLTAVRANTKLWMQTKAYKDGFHNANSFLKSGVWKKPPKITRHLSDFERMMQDA